MIKKEFEVGDRLLYDHENQGWIEAVVLNRFPIFVEGGETAGYKYRIMADTRSNPIMVDDPSKVREP